MAIWVMQKHIIVIAGSVHICPDNIIKTTDQKLHIIAHVNQYMKRRGKWQIPVNGIDLIVGDPEVIRYIFILAEAVHKRLIIVGIIINIKSTLYVVIFRV